MNNLLAVKGFRTFLLIWGGQLISLTGSGLTGFALGVWVFQRTGSVTQFALISLFTALPGILFSPIAGALVDRWDRRWAMILSDAGASLCTVSIVVLLLANRLEVWQIYIIMAVSSTFSAFQWPAYSAATTLLVPKEHLGRAGGMVQIAEAVGMIAAPPLAAVLLGAIQLQGVILIDFITFLFAVSTLLMVRIPRPEVTREGREGRGSLLHEAAFGWQYINARRGLLALLLFFAVTNFTSGVVQVLFTPLVLGFTTVATLGMLMSIGGIALLVGSLTMSAWGGPKRRIFGIYLFSVLSSIALLAVGFPASIAIWAVAVFVYFFGLPIINSCSQAIWQTKTAPDVQGRVFSVRRMIAWSSLPLAYLIAGPLADHIFEPLMSVNGPLANSFGRIIGTGPGRGIALLFSVFGIVTMIVTGIAFLYPRLRRLEIELPDITVKTVETPEEVFSQKPEPEIPINESDVI